MGKTTSILAAVVLCTVFLEPASSNDQNRMALAGVIVGGNYTKVKNVPWQASITDSEGYHICGGAIINPRFVITAAQCIDHSTTGLYVRTGTYEASTGGVKTKIKTQFRHKLYNEETYDYDIGLIELITPLRFGEKMAAIPLFEYNEPIYAEKLVQITGWGSQLPKPNRLKEISVPIADYETCKLKYSLRDIEITSRMHCADGYDEEGNNVCGGDKGAPVVSDGRLLGVVSWTLDCSRPLTPLVYANIAAMRKWVDYNAI